MSNSLVALHSQAPDVMGSFALGQKQAAGIDAARMQKASEMFQIIGSGAMYALGGDINGQVDPAKFAEVMDGLQAAGFDVSQYRNNPGIARVAAQASVSALDRLKLARSDRDYELAVAEFERKFAEDQTQAAAAATEKQRLQANSDREFQLQRDKFDYQKGQDSVREPQSVLGKLRADYDAGLISEEDYKAGVSKANSESGGITVSPDGTVSIGNQLGKLTEGQSKDVNYYIRGRAAVDQLVKLEGALSGIKDRVADKLPFGNYLTSKDYQLANQAGREFIASILRKDTGAAITNQEFEIYGPMFLPQPGDAPEVIEQKRTSRERAIEAIRTGLGAKADAFDAPASGAAPAEAEITSQEQYDALPSGAEFMSGGKRYRKP